MLSGKEIMRRRNLGDIKIEPFEVSRINPNSYNVTLNEKLLVYDNIITAQELLIFNTLADAFNNGVVLNDDEMEIYKELLGKRIIDPKKDNPTKEIIIPESGIVLLPNKLYLGSTNEYTETYNLVPTFDGRSSVGRLGIFVHITAGFGDNGFKGNWTLEISAIQPTIIYPNMEIGQLHYEILDGDPDITYNGKYQNSKQAESSKIYREYAD